MPPKRISSPASPFRMSLPLPLDRGLGGGNRTCAGAVVVVSQNLRHVSPFGTVAAVVSRRFPDGPGMRHDDALGGMLQGKNVCVASRVDIGHGATGVGKGGALTPPPVHGQK
jgi:hypothetical protein